MSRSEAVGGIVGGVIAAGLAFVIAEVLDLSPLHGGVIGAMLGFACAMMGIVIGGIRQ